MSTALDRLAADGGPDVPVHVDAASGGFIAPFVQPELIWDFRLDRMQSINASGHQYGLVYPGVGWGDLARQGTGARWRWRWAGAAGAGAPGYDLFDAGAQTFRTFRCSTRPRYLLEQAGEIAREILDARIVDWSAQGWTQQAIGDEIGCDRSHAIAIERPPRYANTRGPAGGSKAT